MGQDIKTTEKCRRGPSKNPLINLPTQRPRTRAFRIPPPRIVPNHWSARYPPNPSRRKTHVPVEPRHISSHVTRFLQWRHPACSDFWQVNYWAKSREETESGKKGGGFLGRHWYLGRGEGIAVFVEQVLFDVEEGVEKERCHAAPFEVGEEDAVLVLRMNHVEHLDEEEKNFRIIFLPISTGTACAVMLLALRGPVSGPLLSVVCAMLTIARLRHWTERQSWCDMLRCAQWFIIFY